MKKMMMMMMMMIMKRLVNSARCDTVENSIYTEGRYDTLSYRSILLSFPNSDFRLGCIYTESVLYA
jgi:hypothetical protein